MANIKEYDAEGANVLPNIAGDEHEMNTTFIGEIKPTKYMSMTNIKEQYHLEENNWADWSRRITPILKVCKVWGYIDGPIECPDPTTNWDSTKNWEINDKLAKLIVLQSVKPTQLRHVEQALSLAKVWTQLKTLHQSTGYQTALAYMRTLYHMEALEEENIPDLINKMK